MVLAQLVTNAVFEMPSLSTLNQANLFFLRFLKVVRVDQPFPGFEEQFVLRPAKSLRPRGVDTDNSALGIAHCEKVLRYVPDARAFSSLRLDTLFQELIQIAERLLGFHLTL